MQGPSGAQTCRAKSFLPAKICEALSTDDILQDPLIQSDVGSPATLSIAGFREWCGAKCAAAGRGKSLA